VTPELASLDALHTRLIWSHATAVAERFEGTDGATVSSVVVVELDVEVDVVLGRVDEDEDVLLDVLVEVDVVVEVVVGRVDVVLDVLVVLLVDVVVGRVDVELLDVLEVDVLLLLDVVVDVVVGRVDVELLDVVVLELLVDVGGRTVNVVLDVVVVGAIVVLTQLGVPTDIHPLRPESFPALSTADTAK
jgi:hypothetical protein